MPLRPLENWQEVGRRVAAARAARGLTQAALAAELGIARTALAKIEAGTRGLSSLELARLASTLERPIESFVAESLPAVVSRRAAELATTRTLDVAVQDFARDVQLLLDIGALKPITVEPAGMPSTLADVEGLAKRTRAQLDPVTGPLPALDAAFEVLGLYVAVIPLGEDGGDGAYLPLEAAGVAVINGDLPSGRRRYTLAHELGHHVTGDEYVTDWELARARDEGEKRINAFAIHLLMPRQSIVRAWRALGGRESPREATIRLAQDYRVSWTAACSRVQNLELVDDTTATELRGAPPTRAEHLAMGGVVSEDLVAPRMSPALARAVLRAFEANKITSGRAVELLRGAIEEDDLPAVNEVPLEALTGELG
ncbi:MAG: ImmA/IrrE family metallo-endopeptidase [Gemmatimonadaceae bacterium]|nr:ImmA/IrrE family metallo-endopeptidase [Gemmatimonadaceae bacterium]